MKQVLWWLLAEVTLVDDASALAPRDGQRSAVVIETPPIEQSERRSRRGTGPAGRTQPAEHFARLTDPAVRNR